MRTKEKGVTLVALVITIIVLLILASIGYKAGEDSIQSAKFTKFGSELKLIQDKVNQLNQEGNTTIGNEITDSQKQKLNSISEITDVIYKDANDDEKTKIQNSFRECDSNTLKKDLGLDINKTFIISFEYRYVIYLKGFYYKGQRYYIADQMAGSTYNVRYNNTNENTGSFDVTTTRENNKWKVEISNINYNGNIGNWEVKYKTKDKSYWNTSYDLTFYITEQGEYTIKVVHGDEVDLGQKIAILMSDYVEDKGVNLPDLMIGMSAIKFTDPTSNDASGEGTVVKTTSSDNNWYSYTDKKWANAQTEDGSMWVWIPRYAYRINSSTQTTDVVFLIGTSDYYYDESGSLQKAKRQRTLDETIDTSTGYTVHPAFTDESSIGFQNGGWDSELTGIWVAKFEAGYASGNNSAQVKESSVNYTQSIASVYKKEAGTENDSTQAARNLYDGVYGDEVKPIRYPTFQGLTYSLNYLSISDAYSISRVLTESKNIYGFNNKITDSHLMKNSEWGAISYLGKSKYGINSENIYINNVSLDNSINTVYAVTGISANSANSASSYVTIDEINNRTLTNIFNWKQKTGVNSSSTGTIYGIYDLSGGAVERVAGVVLNGNKNIINNGNELYKELTNSTSTKYVTVYGNSNSNETDFDNASQTNYELNKNIYGDAIKEISTLGSGNNSWYEDSSNFPALNRPFFTRGGYFWNSKAAGLCYFNRNDGASHSYNGFRPVLVNKTEKSDTNQIKLNTKYENNTELTDAYGNKIVVPAGFKILFDSTTNATTVDKGIVIEDATGGATNGSQFVWIPVGDIKKADGTTEKIELNRYTFNQNGVATEVNESYIEEDSTNKTELKNHGNAIAKDINAFRKSVSTNGGFYVGRYEARITSVRNSKDDELTRITEKKSEYIYNYVTQLQAAELSENMYKNSNFTSELMNSYAWDTATLFLQTFGDNNKYSRQNSLNTSRMDTGTDNDKQCNVYDMASNEVEWTTETLDNSEHPSVYRGGYYDNSSIFTNSRGVSPYNNSWFNFSFRPILYF